MKSEGWLVLVEDLDVEDLRFCGGCWKEEEKEG